MKFYYLFQLKQKIGIYAYAKQFNRSSFFTDGTSSESSSTPSSPKLERTPIPTGEKVPAVLTAGKKKKSRKHSASAGYSGPGGTALNRQVLASVTQFQRKQKKSTIDVWWLYDDGGLTILLPYILTTRSQFSGCQLRIFTLTSRKDELGTEQRK